VQNFSGMTIERYLSIQSQ